MGGRIALVTGASTGIGAAIARVLAADGVTVAVNHPGSADSAEQADHVVAGIEAAGGRAFPIAADVADSGAVDAMVDHVTRDHGPVEVLVNNAGVIRRSDLLDLDDAQWREILGVDLDGVFFCARAVAAGMVARGRGRIVNIASDLAYTGEARLAHYCAAKGGVLSLTRALALELAPHGITVNAVAPGMTETPMLQANPVTYNPGRLGTIPAGRWGRPEDVAAAVRFLLTDDASYFVGSVLSPNGGIVMS